MREHPEYKDFKGAMRSASLNINEWIDDVFHHIADDIDHHTGETGIIARPILDDLAEKTLENLKFIADTCEALSREKRRRK